MNAPTSNWSQALEELARRAAVIGAELNAQQAHALEIFCRELAEYNQHTNLVARSDPETLVLEHVLDAWTLLPLINRSTGSLDSLVDIGSGAGFPGLVLAIACPRLQVLLIESIGKKAQFLKQTIVTLAIKSRVEVLSERAELAAHMPKYRESFTYATARAVGSLDVIAELALPFLKTHGLLLAQKSSSQLDEELARAKKCLPLLGGHLEEVLPLNSQALPKDRIVLLIEKVGSTPHAYPRPTAQIKRKPLGQ